MGTLNNIIRKLQNKRVLRNYLNAVKESKEDSQLVPTSTHDFYIIGKVIYGL